MGLKNVNVKWYISPSFLKIIMFKISCELFIGWTDSRQPVKDSKPAPITIGWLLDLSIHLLSLPPSSSSFTQSGHNLLMAILSNGYHSFFPSALCGRYLQESIRKWVHYKRPQPHCRWMTRSKAASLQLVQSVPWSWFYILLAASVVRCTMRTFWCETDWCNFKAECNLLSVWHIESYHSQRIT